ncbi:hypothetical protein IQ279_26400 [Streptomyces verrucosisporus]|uniref:hypothetical protein n=1 Tax=Streptomyces verrucosisporus TaxID=1695161 RepID=UPI0019D170E1|nr:hypothetical protein [Streptomyces verrucosisporus]MBN3933093.1 hypothetical protein [Streptomyces verrucosisporus]
MTESHGEEREPPGHGGPGGSTEDGAEFEEWLRNVGDAGGDTRLRLSSDLESHVLGEIV